MFYQKIALCFLDAANSHIAYLFRKRNQKIMDHSHFAQRTFMANITYPDLTNDIYIHSKIIYVEEKSMIKWCLNSDLIDSQQKDQSPLCLCMFFKLVINATVS